MTDEMTEVKTAELSGEALNWAVGKAEGLNMYVAPTVYGVPARTFVNRLRGETVYGQRYNPAYNWSMGGLLIDQHDLEVISVPGEGFAVAAMFLCGEPTRFWPAGETRMIAACRAIVAAKLGDTVSIPRELLP